MRHDAGPLDLGGQYVRPCIARLTVRSKVWLEIDGQFVIGEHGFELLKKIDEHGSLSQAALAVGWSYRHAWGYLRRAEQHLGGALTDTRAGKGRARGAVLSELGRDLIAFGDARASAAVTG